MRILQVKAARGWSREEAAKVFMIDEETMRLWLRRMDEEDGNLVRIREPVNKFPDFVGCLVRQLNVLVPTMGKVRIAHEGISRGGSCGGQAAPSCRGASEGGVMQGKVSVVA
jgi:hypothetical protein